MYNKNLDKMNKETLRMQMLSGIITEGEYKAKLEEAPSMEAYQIAKNLIRDMDFSDEVITNEELFLDVIKALKDQLYEKAADMFATRAGSAPDEY